MFTFVKVVCEALGKNDTQLAYDYDVSSEQGVNDIGDFYPQISQRTTWV